MGAIIVMGHADTTDRWSLDSLLLFLALSMLWVDLLPTRMLEMFKRKIVNTRTLYIRLIICHILLTEYRYLR